MVVINRLALAAVACAFVPTAFAATVSGTVYRDLDADGVFDSATALPEPVIAGVTVTATDELGNVVIGSSNAAGTYSVNLAGNQIRLEYTTSLRIAPGDSGPSVTTGAGSNVQFVTGNTAGLNIGFSDPSQFCQDNPTVVANVYSNGNPHTTTGTAGSNSWLVRAPFVFNDATNPANSTVADGQVIGSTFGLAFQRSTDSLFASAFTKRHSGFGIGDGNPAVPNNENTNETGAIYRISSPAAGSTATLWLDLAAQGINTGSVARVEDANTGVLEAPGTAATVPNVDLDAFDKVGKSGLGQLALSDDERSLWTINLFDRRLYRIPIAISAGVPTPVTAGITSLDVAGSAAAPICTNGLFRPFAVKFFEGFVYVGGVCTAESAGATAANLSAAVLRHDPLGAPGNFTGVATFPLGYPRGDVSNNGTGTPATWRPWRATWGAITAPAPGAATYSQTIQPQPIFSDIDFDVDGTMIVSFMDRLSHQAGNANLAALQPQPNGNVFEGAAGGDTLLACFNSGTGQWALETAGGCAPRLSAGATNGQGPGNGEFFWHDLFSGGYPPSNTPTDGNHREITLGGVALHSIRRELASSVFDPRGIARAAGWRVFGLLDVVATPANDAGANVRSVEIFGQDAGGARPVRFGKAAGIGNVELLCTPPPVELGNRVWRDSNNNGIQDSGEPPISGVVLNLYNATGALLGTATTNTAGEWYFSITRSITVDPSTTDADVFLANPYFNDYYVALAPANFTAGGPLANTSLTRTDADATANGDARDSDAAILTIPGGIGPRAAALVTLGGPGANNHTIDLGVGLPDLGDLPDTGAGTGAGNYETLLANGGPSHPIVPGLRLGANIDSEADGQPNALANGDDTTGAPDDEDGIDITDLAFIAGTAASIDVTATNTTGGVAQLCGFVDFDGNGAFSGAETFSIAVPNAAGAQNVVLGLGAVPLTAVAASYARFRLSTDAGCTPNGAATNGEVEDYPITAIRRDLGDLPDTGAGAGTGNYETLLANGGPVHTIVAGLRIGATVDAEGNGQPSVAANGDDTTGAPDDEDGVNTADLALTAYAPPAINVSVTNTVGAAATLCGFLDINGDGDFADAGETANVPVPNGSNNANVVLNFAAVPINAAANSYARFRLSTAAGCNPNGAAPDGEVEDYPITVAVTRDFGDLPDAAPGTAAGNYSTLLADNGARHVIRPNLRLGALVDAEADGQGTGNANANGDDLAGDDEDGIAPAQLTALAVGSAANITAIATNGTGGAATACGFIDFNGDGDFADANESATAPVPNGANNAPIALNFGIVPDGGVATTFARFRLSTQAGCAPLGDAVDGEVEDYTAAIARTDFGDLPDTGAGVGTNNYETLLASNGARHPIIAGLHLGAVIDAEGNGQPDTGASGDNLGQPLNDEDGVDISSLVFRAGTTQSVLVTGTNTTANPARVCAFVDFDADGNFTGAEIVQAALPAGSVDAVLNLDFTVPLALVGDTSYARVRVSTDLAGACAPNGAASNGEVEDYVVQFELVDFGDLPDNAAGTGAGNYNTLVGDDGASHRIIDDLFIGASVDPEGDGQPSTAADGDDVAATPDDEDGVDVADLALIAGAAPQVSVTVTNLTATAARLCGFIDINGDGDFLDAGEAASAAVPINSNAAVIDLAFPIVPASAATATYARFRLSHDIAGNCAPVGDATDGEVEDYAVSVAGRDLGDLPDPAAGSANNDYATRVADNGPVHPIVPGLFLGTTVDSEGDGQPTASADGDDANGDDEDGIDTATLVFTAGVPSNVDVTVTNTAGSAARICGFVDFNDDGLFDGAGETANVAVPSNSNGVTLALGFTPPLATPTGTVYARFRLSTDTAGACSAVGVATNGEVEDYVAQVGSIDLGDLPDATAGTGVDNYQTRIADNGARHVIVTGAFLGAGVDAEADGQPAPAADGDDLAGNPDDEDGIDIADLVFDAGDIPSVTITRTNLTGAPLNLCGFIDFNGDGDFADAGETASQIVATGTNAIAADLAFGAVPLDATSAYARFRLMPEACAANGSAAAGEVEDYTTTITTFDLGDLPDAAAGTGAGNYLTRIADNGAQHPIVPGLRLGAAIDPELDGQPDAAASGDDSTGLDDEDGVDTATLAFIAGQPSAVNVTVTNTTGLAARVCGFVDFDGNGTFAGAEIASTAVSDGANGQLVPLAFTPPLATPSGQVYARVRLSTDTLGACAPGGLASNGEVEDYVAQVGSLDLGDLPDASAGTGVGNYQTRLADNGPSHVINGDAFLGAGVDAESDGQPSLDALGDDNVGVPDDEDGVDSADLVLAAGQIPSVTVTVTNTTGASVNVCGYIDTNADGDVADAGESATQIVATGALAQPTELVFGAVPLNAVAGYARFRLMAEACAPTGPASLGEVEDYTTTVNQFDLGDLPDTSAGTGTGNYQTLVANGGPRHQIVAGLRLGAAEDAEIDGQPNAAASGDDTTGTDDEDGVTLPPGGFVRATPASLAITATNTLGVAATACGFIDWNADGDFADAGETASVVVPDGSNGANLVLAFGNVPPAAADASYARVRLSTGGACSATGDAANGEVEDYAVTVSDVPATNVLSVGNLVWEDLDNNGLVDPGEPGVPNVPVSLYPDANNDCVADGAALATQVTTGTGGYLFPGLEPGTYIIGITPAPIFVGSTGTGRYATPGPYEPAPDPDNNADNDDNGTRLGIEIRTCGVTLATGTEPVNDGDADSDSNLSVDLGLVRNFDLALRKQLSPGQPTQVAADAFVNFTITVINQGTVTATNIVVTDSIPAGMELADAAWTVTTLPEVRRTLAGPLLPGASLVTTIRLRIIEAGQSPFVNFAEISVANDDGDVPRTDIDSLPDADPDNDGTPVDDNVDNDNGDEDDSDIATVTVISGIPPTLPPQVIPVGAPFALFFMALAFLGLGWVQVRRRG